MNLNQIKKIFATVVLIFFLSACGNDDNNSVVVDIGQVNKIVSGDAEISVPTLVILMNWDDYAESDETLWHDKIFNISKESVNRWYADSTHSKVQMIPISENSGIADDGVILVDMGTARPDRIIDNGANYDFTAFVSDDITKAINSDAVTSNVDFSLFDIDKNGIVDYSELQIIFIVAGGEMAYGDTRDAIWAHSWNYAGATVDAPVLNGVKLMYATGDLKTSGTYAAFGAIHGLGQSDAHKASIGIIAHELGHSLLNLIDLYDISYTGSGVGYFDIMGAGTWAKSESDTYDGDSPTQFSAYSKLDAIPSDVETLVMDPTVTSSISVTLNCSDTELLKLTTAKENEYFLIGCRDTQRAISDAGFMSADSTFTTDRLFSVLYHVDTSKTDNSEGGTQTLENHYKVAVVQKSYQTTMATSAGIRANFEDVFTVDTEMDTTHTTMYDGNNSGYTVAVVSQDTTNRTMTFNIQR